MGYSDYGGFVYRNGVLVPERSDVLMTTDGRLLGAPGAYPPWAHESATGESYHAVLGSGPDYVCLFKQSLVTLVSREGDRWVERGGEFSWNNPPPPDKKFKYTLERGARVEVVHTWEEDPRDAEGNFYVYGAVYEPDGTVWTGFSGFGVGAGLDKGPQEFSTEARIEALRRHFPSRNEPT